MASRHTAYSPRTAHAQHGGDVCCRRVAASAQIAHCCKKITKYLHLRDRTVIVDPPQLIHGGDHTSHGPLCADTAGPPIGGVAGALVDNARHDVVEESTAGSLCGHCGRTLRNCSHVQVSRVRLQVREDDDGAVRHRKQCGRRGPLRTPPLSASPGDAAHRTDPGDRSKDEAMRQPRMDISRI